MGALQNLGVILLACIGLVFATECSVENRVANLTLCQERILTNFYDTNLFWFGNQYATNCPNGFLSGPSCTNPSLTGKSLGTRLFDKVIDIDQLTKFLTVKFTSDPGQYTGCGNTFTINEIVRTDLDPSGSHVVTPWYVRHVPEMTWEATEGEYYSIYVYDAGYFITHAVYINIQGNDIPTSGENVIDQYHGPLRSNEMENVYVFMLFKQPGRLEPLDVEGWYNATNGYGFANSSHIPTFVSLFNMTGPVAINWMEATGDEYAAQTMFTRGILVNCPVFIGRALDQTARPFLPNPASLTVQMDVTFQVDELDYYSCCVNHTERARSFTLNPIGNELLNTAATRTGLDMTIAFRKLGMYQTSMNFTGDQYTMICLDPDVPGKPQVGNTTHPLLHMMQINIVDGTFSSGETVIPWSGPYPPNDEPHYYYFLLYKHTAQVTATQMKSYAGNCSPGLADKCLYDINSAVSGNNFMLVGANWFRAKRDAYVIYRNVQSNPNSTHAQCGGQTGYTLDCIDATSAGQTACVRSSAMSILSFLFVVVLSLYM